MMSSPIVIDQPTSDNVQSNGVAFSTTPVVVSQRVINSVSEKTWNHTTGPSGCCHNNTAFDEKKFCTSVFLDIAQAFDKVWHDNLFYKVKKWLPATFFHFLNSYIRKRHFFDKQAESRSDLKPNFADDSSHSSPVTSCQYD